MKRTDLLLKIIVAAEGEPVTPVQLQKVAFLVGEKFPSELPNDYYDFEPFHYGPFCVDLYRDAEALEREGLVLINTNHSGGWKEFSASFRSATADLSFIPQHISEFIDTKLRWAKEAGFQEVIRAIYNEYPKFRVNGIFQG